MDIGERRGLFTSLGDRAGVWGSACIYLFIPALQIRQKLIFPLIFYGDGFLRVALFPHSSITSFIYRIIFILNINTVKHSNIHLFTSHITFRPKIRKILQPHYSLIPRNLQTLFPTKHLSPIIDPAKFILRKPSAATLKPLLIPSSPIGISSYTTINEAPVQTRARQSPAHLLLIRRVERRVRERGARALRINV